MFIAENQIFEVTKDVDRYNIYKASYNGFLHMS